MHESCCTYSGHLATETQSVHSFLFYTHVNRFTGGYGLKQSSTAGPSGQSTENHFRPMHTRQALLQHHLCLRLCTWRRGTMSSGACRVVRLPVFASTMIMRTAL